MGIAFGMPRHEDFLEMRGSNGFIYFEFLDRFVRHVVGARKFDSMSFERNLSKFACISDEAFAVGFTSNTNTY